MSNVGGRQPTDLCSTARSQILGEAGEWIWDFLVRPDEFPFLLDHRVRGVPIMPGSMYVELALAFFFAVRKTHNGRACLKDLTFPYALALQAGAESKLRMLLKENTQCDYLFTCQDCETGNLYARMRVGSLDNAAAADLESFRQVDGSYSPASAFYSELREGGNDYGPGMQAVSRYVRGRDVVQADVTGLTPPPDGGDFHLHPVGLDAGIQALASAYAAPESPFVLTGIEQIRVFAPLSGPNGALRANLTGPREPTDGTALGDFVLFHGAGDTVVEATGIRLHHIESALPRHGEDVGPKTPIAISATFTAEPVKSSLLFWGEELGTPFDPQFAPYNQVFQELLDPGSLLRRNRDGANVIFLRYQDWDQGGRRVNRDRDKAEVERTLAGPARRTLPNGLEIAHLNRYETDYLFQEIFVDRSYLRHGIELKDGDCVIDIGANIGLFTLFVQSECEDTSIFAFEPSPRVADLLRANAELYGSNVKVFDCGISDADKEAEFTFYEKSSVFSTFSPDVAEDEAAIRAVIRNNLSQIGITDNEELSEAVEEFMSGRMDSQSFTCRLRSLSSVIEEQGIDKIDLLKIDAEKSELAVLRGIKDADWPKIRQIVLEVHDRTGVVVKSVEQCLRSKGFELTLEEEPMLRGSGLFNIYAQRQRGVSDGRADGAGASPVAKLEQTTREFASALRSTATTSSAPYFVVSCPATPDPNGVLTKPTSEAMEALLSKELDDAKNVHFVSGDELLAHYHVDDFFDPQADRLGHVPYTPAFYCALGTLVARRLDAARRKPYKVIALDCDNTLWGGVCGEDGADNLDVGGSWKILQEHMVAQHEQGMLLCLCSKNTEEDVFSVFESRPEIPLRREHLVEHRINWDAKSRNLISLSKSLNVGLDSFIFIDDNAVECAEVRTYCPEVLVLELPSDPRQVPSFLKHVWAFDRAKVTEEDRSRTRLYKENQRRERFREEAQSLTDFLNGLGLDIRISSPEESQLSRVAQLTQRTNQFNTTTIRRSEPELRSLLDREASFCLVVEVSDRFGDYGLVGVVLYTVENGSLDIDSFLLSCRVLGRGVEHKIVAELGEIAARRGCATVDFHFEATAKNTPALAFLRSVGAAFETDQGERKIFSLPCDTARAVTYDPDHSPFLADGDDAAATPVERMNNAHGTTPIDYGRIAEAYREAEDVLRAVTARRHRDSEAVAEGYVEPASDTERAIARIWEQVLGVGRVGAEHSFKELGGDSLTSVMLVSQLKRDLGVDLSVTDLFEFPTVRTLAKMLDASHDTPTGNGRDHAGQERGSRIRQRRMARRGAQDRG